MEGNGQTSAARDAQSSEAVDDRGTSPTEGIEILKRLRQQGFDDDNAKLALALGRPVEEVEKWMNGAETPDDDIVMKARGIATQRNLEIG